MVALINHLLTYLLTHRLLIFRDVRSHGDTRGWCYSPRWSCISATIMGILAIISSRWWCRIDLAGVSESGNWTTRLNYSCTGFDCFKSEQSQIWGELVFGSQNIARDDNNSINDALTMLSAAIKRQYSSTPFNKSATLVMSPLRRHIFVCFMAKSAFWVFFGPSSKTGSDPYSAWMKYVVCLHLYIPWKFGERGSTPRRATRPSLSFCLSVTLRC